VSRVRTSLLAGLLAVVFTACATGNTPGRPPVTFDPRPYYSRPALHVLHGQASYYHDSLAGNVTANGETYELDVYSAAHRTLPFGTIVRVTRVATGDWVLVRINDRGPFGRKSRILDLSRIAAESLGMLRAGVADVRVEVLELGASRTRR
jgi:rare lipoprotein A